MGGQRSETVPATEREAMALWDRVRAYRCWTCGSDMTAEEWRTAVREPSDDTLRWCIDCHYRVEMGSAPLAVGNMLRYVAGLPIVEATDG